MTLPMIQIMIGIGIGLVGFLFLRPAIQNYHNNPTSSRRRRGYDDYEDDDGHNFKSNPGDICSICCESMSLHQMKYLPCGHALHNACYREFIKFRDICPLCRKKI